MSDESLDGWRNNASLDAEAALRAAALLADELLLEELDDVTTSDGKFGLRVPGDDMDPFGDPVLPGDVAGLIVCVKPMLDNRHNNISEVNL